MCFPIRNIEWAESRQKICIYTTNGSEFAQKSTHAVKKPSMLLATPCQTLSCYMITYSCYVSRLAIPTCCCTLHRRTRGEYLTGSWAGCVSTYGVTSSDRCQDRYSLAKLLLSDWDVRYSPLRVGKNILQANCILYTVCMCGGVRRMQNENWKVPRGYTRLPCGRQWDNVLFLGATMDSNMRTFSCL